MKKIKFGRSVKKGQMIKALILVAAVLVQIPNLLPTIGSLTSRITHMPDELLYRWVTLAACLLWLILKWRNINQTIARRRIPASLKHATLGLALCAASLAAQLTYKTQSFFEAAIPASIFISGAFAALGSLTPLAISGAYMAGVILPDIIEAYADKQFSMFSASATTLALRILGIEASAQGAHIRIQTAAGGAINAYVDHICAGSSSLSVFICLFTLITIDLQIKPGWKMAAFFIAGSLGTVAQAILRLIIMGIVGANYGLEAFLTAHRYLGYILFSLYFILFTYVYMRSAGKQSLNRRAPREIEDGAER